MSPKTDREESLERAQNEYDRAVAAHEEACAEVGRNLAGMDYVQVRDAEARLEVLARARAAKKGALTRMQNSREE